MNVRLNYQNSNWQKQLRSAVTNSAELFELLEISPEVARSSGLMALPQFPLKVPHAYLSRIKKGQLDDPLLRQILPLNAEHEVAAGETDDPVGDLDAYQVDGLIHKYHGRALIIVSGACGIHCRYCFRKHFPYSEKHLSTSATYDYLMAHQDVEEVILSGGDPLSYSNDKLFRLCEKLEGIVHIKRIRLHTRLAIALPARLDAELVDWFKQREKPYIIVFHINHPNEIDTEVATAVATLKSLTLLNQAVLLHKVNDSVDVLKRLSERCFEIGILPYYLHMLDAVKGTSHFAVSATEAKQLMRQLSALLPGYLVPKLVKEYPRQASKTIIA